MANRRELDLRLEAFRELMWHTCQQMATISFDQRVLRLTLGQKIIDINQLINQTKKEIYELRANRDKQD